MTGLMSTTELGVMVFKARYKAGLTQSQLAQKAHMSPDYISKLESGTIKKPSPKAMNALSKALDLDMDTLLDILLK